MALALWCVQARPDAGCQFWSFTAHQSSRPDILFCAGTHRQPLANRAVTVAAAPKQLVHAARRLLMQCSLFGTARRTAAATTCSLPAVCAVNCCCQLPLSAADAGCWLHHQRPVGQRHRQAGRAHPQQAAGSRHSHAAGCAGVPGRTAVTWLGDTAAAQHVHTGGLHNSPIAQHTLCKHHSSTMQANTTVGRCLYTNSSVTSVTAMPSSQTLRPAQAVEALQHLGTFAQPAPASKPAAPSPCNTWLCCVPDCRSWVLPPCPWLRLTR